MAIMESHSLTAAALLKYWMLQFAVARVFHVAL